MKLNSDKQVTETVRTNYNPAMLGYGGNWQVIFETAKGLDYCRETMPSTMNIEEVIKWTEKQIRNYPEIATAVIEFF